MFSMDMNSNMKKTIQYIQSYMQHRNMTKELRGFSLKQKKSTSYIGNRQETKAVLLTAIQFAHQLLEDKKIRFLFLMTKSPVIVKHHLKEALVGILITQKLLWLFSILNLQQQQQHSTLIHFNCKNQLMRMVRDPLAFLANKFSKVTKLYMNNQKLESFQALTKPSLMSDKCLPTRRKLRLKPHHLMTYSIKR